ncbi:MAG: CapA family protein [Eggerthellaceae bacterium]|nr:CapA family protein [Eggerthellaceae bacterium]
MQERNKTYRPTPRKRTRVAPQSSNATDSEQRTVKRENAAQKSTNKLIPIIAGLASLFLVGTFAFALSSGKISLGASPSSDAAQTSASRAAATSDSQEGNEANSSEEVVTKTTEPYSVSFLSTGDFIIWRNEAQYVDENGGASATAKVADYVASADVTITNVESPLSDNSSEPILAKDVYILGRPAAIESIEACGVDIASLANNHIMDYSGPALKDTIDALDAIGVKHAGAGMTEEEAAKMVEHEVNGVSIAFFAWTDIVPEYFVAYGDEPGVVSARLNMEDACKRVREAKKTHDIVIVAMHWGIEYEHYTTPSLQDEPAHQLVDAGADVILGNHPHVVQGIEFYKDARIAYAHGNFVFYQIYDDTHESYLMNFDVTNEGIKNVVLTPLHLDDAWGIPDFATGEVAQATLERLEEISSDMNTKFEIRDGKAYVTPATSASDSDAAESDMLESETSETEAPSSDASA